MKEQIAEDDDLLPEYDFDRMPIIRCGPGHQKKNLFETETAIEHEKNLPDDDLPSLNLRQHSGSDQASSTSAASRGD